MEVRDAGIDFNVPFPPALASLSGRHVDLLIVRDASGGAKGCKELEKAMKAGYVEIDPRDPEKLTTPFLKDTCVRIFRPVRPGNQYVVFYILGINDMATEMFAYTNAQINIVTSTARKIVTQKEVVDWLRAQIFELTTFPTVLHRSLAKIDGGLKSQFSPLRSWLEDYYAAIYENMQLLSDNAFKFSEMFTSLTVMEMKKDGSLKPGRTHDAHAIWRAADETGLTKIVIEGGAGCGQSTHFARDQLWGDRFGVVVMVEMLFLTGRLRKDSTTGRLPMPTPELYLSDYFKIKDEKKLAEWIALLREHADRVLWIFDGFEEVESGLSESRDPHDFPQFLLSLTQGGKLTSSWAPNVIVTSRRERRTRFSGFVHTEPQGWNETKVKKYVKKFFDGSKGDDEEEDEGGGGSAATEDTRTKQNGFFTSVRPSMPPR